MQKRANAFFLDRNAVVSTIKLQFVCANSHQRRHPNIHAILGDESELSRPFRGPVVLLRVCKERAAAKTSRRWEVQRIGVDESSVHS